MTDDIADWDRQSTSVPYSGEAFDVRRDVFSGPDDSFAVEYLDTADAVTVLPFTPEGAVLVVEEWRHSVERVDLGLPSGQLEPVDVDPTAAARRELREETGHETDHLESLGTFEPLNSLIDASIHYFVARNCRPTGEPDPDADERIRVRTRSLAELREAVRRGDLTDTKTAFAVLYVSLFEQP